ncbi:hypothetical protein L1987_59684 [Smallanthus sonchifolius]|uniref:Uncharacterized protein n=1 Tax=Smallanthus sonchifolius TaxID=185202 RepID=A0ACB9D646_9ASTR|nr:hypothetical protein L1987_59684 [Smallanthus sonchifolius]
MLRLQVRPEIYRKEVLDIEKIRSGEITVVPGIKRFSRHSVQLVNGETIDIDSVVLATGYRSNVPCWLQETEFFAKNGFPNTPFPNGWKGKRGLYASGFTRRGLAGASADAVKIAQDIGKVWKEELNQKKKKFILSEDASQPSKSILTKN